MSNPHTFVAIYSGDTISSAKIVAASSDPDLVSKVADVLLKEKRSAIQAPEGDSISTALNNGRFRALQIINDGSAE